MPSLPHAAKLIKEAAEKLGSTSNFAKVAVAVDFDRDFRPDHHQSEQALIDNGQLGELSQKGKCVHLGNCNIGCKVGAKKTLDKNYIKWAEEYGATVWPLHLVHRIEPLNSEEPQQGYYIHVENLAATEEQENTITASIVVVAAGSLGSTELMLRCKQAGLLPNLSAQLGTKWSYNGNVNTLALYPPAQAIEPMKGPHTTAKISFMDGKDGTGQRFVIEDAGFPALLSDYLKAGNNQKTIGPILGEKLLQILDLLARNAVEAPEGPNGEKIPLTPEQLWENLLMLLALIAQGKPAEDEQVQGLAKVIGSGLKASGKQPTDFVMPWFAEGLDAGDGRVSLATVEVQVSALSEKEQVLRKSNPVSQLLRKSAENALRRYHPARTEHSGGFDDG